MFILAYNRRYRGGRIALDVQHDLRTAVFRQLQQLDFAKHDELQTGQLVSRASSDVALIQGFLQFMPIGVANVLMFIVSIVAMLILSPLLACVMLFVGPALLFTAIRLRTSVFPASWDAQQKAGDVANVVEEDVTGVRVVKGFGQEGRELERLDAPLAAHVRVARVRLVNLQARLQPAMQTIPALGQVAVLALGGYLALEGHISLGTFLAFSTYMLQLTPPIRQLAAILTVGQLARAGAERIFDLLDSTPLVQDKPDAVPLEVPNGAVHFDDVTFGYTSTEPVLQRLLAHGRAGRDGRARRHLGLGQVDGRAPAAALLRRARRARDDRRHRRARRHAAVAARRHRRRVRGLVPLLRLDQRQHRVRAARRVRRPRSKPRRARPKRTSSSCGSRTATTPSSANRDSRSRAVSASASRLRRALLSDPRILLLDDATSSVDVRASRRRSTRRCAASRPAARRSSSRTAGRR